jgi:hypothetical protein
LSAVFERLFKTFAATLHIWRLSRLSATSGRAMSWWLVSWEDVVWIDPAQGRDKWANPCESGDEISVSVKRGEFFDVITSLVSI